MKPTARIDNWVLVETQNGQKWLTGKITGHPRQDDFYAGFQSTSEIVEADWDNNLVETKNTIYILGPKAAPFGRVFP